MSGVGHTATHGDKIAGKTYLAYTKKTVSVQFYKYTGRPQLPYMNLTILIINPVVINSTPSHPATFYFMTFRFSGDVLRRRAEERRGL